MARHRELAKAVAVIVYMAEQEEPVRRRVRLGLDLGGGDRQAIVSGSEDKDG